VTEVSAAQKGTPTKEPTKENLPASGGDLPKHESVVKVSWKVDNQDNDALRYRVAFKREGQNLWRDANAEDHDGRPSRSCPNPTVSVRVELGSV